MANYSAREFKNAMGSGELFPDGIHEIIFASKEQKPVEYDSMAAFKLTFTQMEMLLFPSALLLRSEDGQVLRLDAIRSICVSRSSDGGIYRINILCGSRYFPEEMREFTLLVF